MEDADVDWKNEDEKAPADYKSDVVNWLNQGLNLGKMVLVTGIIISSAPVVLPSLAVISALGIAISVPYGIFLASYVCTERLMAFLLPKAVPPSMEEYRALTYDDEDEEKYMKTKQEEDEQVERTGDQFVGKENETEEAPRQSEEASEMEPKSMEEDNGEKHAISEELVLEHDGNEEKKSEIEVIPAIFEEKKDQDEAKDIEIQVEPAKTTTLVEQMRGKGRHKEREKKAKGKKLNQDMNKGVADKAIARDVVLDKDRGPKVNEIVQVIERKTEENIETSSSPDKKSPHKATNLPKKGLKQTAHNGSGTSPVEEVYSEKKIWEEINALRTIVGYKAPPLPSIMEELKALYRFTGVQTPASVKNPSDLTEVTNKLRFLMATVGVI